jgi:hypothetical protein
MFADEIKKCRIQLNGREAATPGKLKARTGKAGDCSMENLTQ